uniref:Uncharacterized protein n=1 Tax=Anopheles maculatus TaxID=74869 RepID=A0A182SVF9_9DIPT
MRTVAVLEFSRRNSVKSTIPDPGGTFCSLRASPIVNTSPPSSIGNAVSKGTLSLMHHRELYGTHGYIGRYQQFTHDPRYRKGSREKTKRHALLLHQQYLPVPNLATVLAEAGWLVTVLHGNTEARYDRATNGTTELIYGRSSFATPKPNHGRH